MIVITALTGHLMMKADMSGKPNFHLVWTSQLEYHLARYKVFVLNISLDHLEEL